ncbi:MAG TPA: SDR family NAD(P)-dependent oxidoreductase [Pseudorhodoplanes sp.]|jgi:3-oxoacyl-[acyl-carrier protein] reductase|nr:SDR family NAD(P)-dependent oxidoreductase [Pseudorhodoplanes sp.]
MDDPRRGQDNGLMAVSYDFSDRTAVVTGGAGGIGEAIARALLQAGARVDVWDLVPGRLDGARYRIVDVTDAAQIAAALAQVGPLDIVVNNAGLAGGSARVVDLAPQDWRRIIEVNLTGVYEVARQTVPLLVRSPAGRMVNIASLAGKEGTPNLSAYSAAKAGVIAFTKSLAKELADTAVRVNAIAPAAVDTAILGQMAPEVVAAMIAKSPLKRLGTVGEVAALALWLCSEACTFSTGATFDLSGGRATY